MLNSQAQEIGLILIYDCDPALPSSLFLDQQRIKQILLNLVQNALKFTQTGHIKIEIKYNKKGQKLIVSVSDTEALASKKKTDPNFSSYLESSKSVKKLTPQE